MRFIVLSASAVLARQFWRRQRYQSGMLQTRTPFPDKEQLPAILIVRSAPTTGIKCGMAFR